MRPADAESGREVWAELAFEAPIPAGAGAPAVLVGSLDRLVRDTDGGGAGGVGPRYTIVDFKITEEPKSDEALIDAYGTQMELYARGLRQLEPEAGLTEALLVSISAGSVREVPVPLGRLDVEDVAARATSIVAGRAGKPRPGELCRFCDFRSVCSEAKITRKRK
jgi:hypothetical protein